MRCPVGEQHLSASEGQPMDFEGGEVREEAGSALEQSESGGADGSSADASRDSALNVNWMQVLQQSSLLCEPPGARRHIRLDSRVHLRY